MVKKKWYLLILSYWIISCSQNINKKARTQFTLQKVDNATIKNIPDNNYFAYMTYVLDQGKHTYLIRDNYNANAYLVYDWSQKKLIKKTYFKYEGTNGISYFLGAAIFPIQTDSLVITTVTGMTYITKNDSIMFRQRNMLGNNNYRSYGLNPYKPQKIKNEIFFWRAADHLPTEKAYYQDPLYFKYNMQTHKISPLNIVLPPVFDNQKWSSFQTDSYFTKKNDQLIIGFAAIPTLYIYNPKANKVTDTIHPDYGSFTKQTKAIADDDENEAKKLKQTEFYNNIEYDPYRDVFYRFYFTPSKKTTGLTNKFDFWTSMPFVIQVLNNKFKLIAEKKLPEKHYNLRDYFVTQEGLWLSANHPDNPDYNEDELHFELFKLMKKK